MPERSSPLSEAELALYRVCRQLLAHLSELTAFHLTIDTPERVASEAESATSLRLRKVYFHIQAVMSWPIDTLIVHVMGPDIRTAQRHLEPIATEFLSSPSSRVRTNDSERMRDTSSSLLDAVSHPTAQTLILPRHRGGLGDTDLIVCLAELVSLLGGLAGNYSAALGKLTDEFGISETPELLDIMTRLTDVFASMQLSQVLKPLDIEDAVEH